MRGYWRERRRRRFAWTVVLLLVVVGGVLLGIARWHGVGGDHPGEAPKPEAVEIAEEEMLILPLASADWNEILVRQGAGWVTDPLSLPEQTPVSGEGSYRYRQRVSCDLPLVAIVVDDVGYNAVMARRLAESPLPLTWAIIPGLKNTVPCRKVAEDVGIPYMVHMPMQATGDKKGSRWFELSWIVEGLSPKSVRSAVEKALEELPNAVAMNNHRGSLSTLDDALMAPLMKTLREHQIGFLDSRTVRGSVAYRVAVEHGLPTRYNSVFIDHYNNEKFIKDQIGKLVLQAKRRGWAVGICHIRPATLAVLQHLRPEHFEGVRFVTIPELFSCPMP